MEQAPFSIDDLGDPFQGDYGDDERLLKDVVGKVRKPFVCHMCAQETSAGTWARIRIEVNYEGIKTYRWCALCCLADKRMMVYDENDEDPNAEFIARERLGHDTRAALEAASGEGK